MFDIYFLGKSFFVPQHEPELGRVYRFELLCGSDTPVAVENPGALLALLAAVFRSPASSALGKLSCELLPFPTLVVCTLPNPAPTIVLAAQISHDHSCPVLHVLAVVPNREFLDKRENVEVVWEEILFFFGIAGRGNGRGRRRVWVVVVNIEEVQFRANLELGNEM